MATAQPRLSNRAPPIHGKPSNLTYRVAVSFSVLASDGGGKTSEKIFSTRQRPCGRNFGETHVMNRRHVYASLERKLRRFRATRVSLAFAFGILKRTSSPLARPDAFRRFREKYAPCYSLENADVNVREALCGGQKRIYNAK